MFHCSRILKDMLARISELIHEKDHPAIYFLLFGESNKNPFIVCETLGLQSIPRDSENNGLGGHVGEKQNYKQKKLRFF